MYTDNKWQMRMAESIDWDQDNSRLYENYDLTDVRWLKMSGGETLIDPSCFKIWKQLVDHGDAKNIKLHIITNGTVWPKQAVELLSQFKGLQLRFSVDGIGKVFEYCRTGCEWKKVHANFLKACELPNIHNIGFNSVINVYNIFHIYYHVAWMIEQSRRFEFIDPPALHPIVEPMHLNVHWLDEDHKDFIRSEIDRVIYDYNINDREQECFQQVYSDLNKDVSHYRKESEFTDNIPENIEKRADRWMIPNIQYNKEQFVSHTLVADKIRKTNVLEITPQLERYLI
jgi:MoaA/NifB/PqqE/SkfB family radical SAM enzyme